MTYAHPHGTYSARHWDPPSWAIVASIIALVAALWLAWAFWGTAEPEMAVEARGPILSTVTLSDVAENPRVYSGHLVAVTGDLDEVLEPEAFVLEAPGVIDGSKLLVLGTTGQPLSVAAGEGLRVTGTVAVFEEHSVEAELGYALDDDLYRDWEGRTVLFATSVAASTERQ